MDKCFRIVFQGKIREGMDPAAVRRHAAVRLKVNASQLERIFSGPRIVLKQHLDAAQGSVYLRALDELGMVARLEPMPDDTPPAVTPRQEQNAATPALTMRSPVAAGPRKTPQPPTGAPTPRQSPSASPKPGAAPSGANTISHIERTHANLARAEALLNASLPRTPPAPPIAVTQPEAVRQELAAMEAQLGRLGIGGIPPTAQAAVAARLALPEAQRDTAGQIEAPIVFTTAVDCTHCGTRHIVEGKLTLIMTPVAGKKMESA